MRWKWVIYFLTCSIVTVLGGTILLLVVGLLARAVPGLDAYLAALTLEPLGSGYLLAAGAFAFSGVIAGVVASAWLGLSFTSRVTEHLRSVAWGAESLARGDLSFRLPPSEDEDLQMISDSFNQMGARIESQVNALQSMAEENALLMDQASEKAALEERRRLASDLHDAVAQLLFAINMSISAAIKLLPKSQAKAEEQMEYVRDMAARAQAEMRALLMHLRPASLGDKGFRAATEDLLAEVRQRSGIDVELSLADVTMPRSVEDNLFRIMQEAVANSMKHSSASMIRVAFTHTGERLTLSVEDDGVGMPVNTEKQVSYGLKTMEERAGKIGGAIRWLSLTGKGTRVEVRVPLRGSDEGGDSAELHTSGSRR